jgi:hypothetical protein
MTDEIAIEKGFFEFDLDAPAHSLFLSYVKKYVREEHQAMIEITSNSPDYFAGF